MADAITSLATPEQVKKVVEKNKKESAQQPVAKEQAVQKDVVSVGEKGKKLIPNGKTYIETF